MPKGRVKNGSAFLSWIFPKMHESAIVVENIKAPKASIYKPYLQKKVI
jgi:hypothetical protein